MNTRKLVTISLPPRLLAEAERAAETESRTKSELFREALRFYLKSSEARRKSSRDQLFAIIDRIQERASGTPARRIRKIIKEAIQAARKAS